MSRTLTTKQILDPCCGSKIFWFNKANDMAIFCDIRKERTVLCDGRVLNVEPDTIADFRRLPFADKTFSLIVFDPPHLVRVGETSWMFKKFGELSKNSWQTDLSEGFMECWRVLAPRGTLVFKWCEDQIKLNDVLACFGENPVFGHKTRKKTFWMCFFKSDNESRGNYAQGSEG